MTQRKTEPAPADAANISESRPNKQRGRPFAKGQSGNPAGRKPGELTMVHRLVKQRLNESAEEIVNALVERAKKGSTEALALCLDRMAPAPRHEPRTPFEIGSLATLADCLAAQRKIALAVAGGSLAEDHAKELSAQIGACVKLAESSEIEQKLALIAKHLGIDLTKAGSSIMAEY